MGKGMAQDYDRAINYYEFLSGQEYAPVQYQLGMMYLKGTGVEQDSIEAYKYFDLATQKGIFDARYQLALMHQDGTVVTQNLSIAKEFFETVCFFVTKMLVIGMKP